MACSTSGDPRVAGQAHGGVMGQRAREEEVENRQKKLPVGAQAAAGLQERSCDASGRGAWTCARELTVCVSSTFDHVVEMPACQSVATGTRLR